MFKNDNKEYESNINELINSIVKLNRELIVLEKSQVLKKNIMIKNFKKHFKNRDFKHIIKRIRIRKNMSRLPVDVIADPQKKEIKNNYFNTERIAIYSVLFGNYDCINEPIFCPDNCDFYMITDQEIPPNSRWNKLDISFLESKIHNYNNIEKNRVLKMRPDMLFPDYKYSIYLDSNILIVGDLTAMINTIGESGMAFHAHRHRDCVYSEAKAAAMLNKIDKQMEKKYYSYLRYLNMPKHFGLAECNIIAREHSNPLCLQTMNEWWKEFINGDVKRDQLYLPIALKKCNIDVNEVTSLGFNVYENPLVRVLFHN